jgi:lipopolysaccharide export system permease protein
MRLLDRYLLRELLTPLAYCLAGFLVFWMSSDLITEIDSFQQERLGAAGIARYYLFKLPEFAVLILPLGLLLALLYALTNHARHQEITAMRAAGISLWRVCLPYVGVGLSFSLLTGAMNEFLVPAGGERAQALRKRSSGSSGESAGPNWKSDVKFRNDREQRFWRIRAYNLGTGEMRQPYVEYRLTNGLARQLIADRAIRSNEVWTFYSGRVFDPDPESRAPILPFDMLAVPELTETPSQIASEYKIGRLSSIAASRGVHLTISEILNYQWLHPDLRPRDRALLETQLHARLAWPWTCLVVVLIAVPFAAASGRRNAYIGVASSIFIGVVYFVLQRLGMALGTGGYAPAILAAWLPNFLFASTGVFLISRVR